MLESIWGWLSESPGRGDLITEVPQWWEYCHGRLYNNLQAQEKLVELTGPLRRSSDNKRSNPHTLAVLWKMG